MSQNDSLKQELLDTDDEYRRLFEEHQNFERRLETLHQKSFPSQEDEQEEKRIKLQKLRLKDRMQVILRAHRETGVSANPA
jgi:uncharacterized protein YdcH (DUF465 family)